MKIGVNKIVEKMFITPEMPKILKEILQIQSAAGQGIGRFYIILNN
ncbi:hypothetical protein ACFL2E_01495 [Thermodesulfobacteriota bacterium]